MPLAHDKASKFKKVYFGLDNMKVHIIAFMLVCH